MTQAARIDGDLRVTGALVVGGSMPNVARSELTQDNNAIVGVDLTSLRVHDAIQTNLPGTSATDDLALNFNTAADAAGAMGTDPPMVNTGDVKTVTITRYARFTHTLRPEYVDGQSVSVRLHAGMRTTVSDGTATVDIECYKSDEEGGVGSDLCTTSATTINSLTFADTDFVITGTGLSAGDTLDIRVTVAVSDTATATVVVAAIGAVKMLLDIKG